MSYFNFHIVDENHLKYDELSNALESMRYSEADSRVSSEKKAYQILKARLFDNTFSIAEDLILFGNALFYVDQRNKKLLHLQAAPEDYVVKLKQFKKIEGRLKVLTKKKRDALEDEEYENIQEALNRVQKDEVEEWRKITTFITESLHRPCEKKSNSFFNNKDNLFANHFFKPFKSAKEALFFTALPVEVPLILGVCTPFCAAITVAASLFCVAALVTAAGMAALQHNSLKDSQLQTAKTSALFALTTGLLTVSAGFCGVAVVPFLAAYALMRWSATGHQVVKQGLACCLPAHSAADDKQGAFASLGKPSEACNNSPRPH